MNVSPSQQFLSWPTSLECNVVKLAGGGSVAVAASVAVAVSVSLAVSFVGFSATIRTNREI